MPPISFPPEVPVGSRVPFFYAAFDTSRAQQGPSIQPFQGLVIGQRTSTGTIAALTPSLVLSADIAGEQFGFGSQLHRMAVALFANDRTIPWTFVALDDNGSNKATGTITITGTQTKAGTIFLYVAGQAMQIPVAVGETNNDVATAIGAAITALPGLPVTAGVATNVVTLTAKNAGTIGNDIDIRTNFYPNDQKTPAGLVVTIVPMASGATDPDYSTVWGVVGEEQFNIVVSGLATSSAYTAIQDELEARKGPDEQLQGIGFFGVSDTFSNLVTLGSGKNTGYISTIGMDDAMQPPWEWAAGEAARVAGSARNDPARPFQTLELNYLIPPPATSRFTKQEREVLLQNGISTFTVDAGGNARIERAISMYQKNEAGADSTALLDLNTPFTLDYILYDLRTQTAQTFPRHKLRDDGKSLPAGQAIVTPNIYKAFVVSLFEGWEALGLVEGIDQFKRDLIVERNIQDPNRLDVLLPPDLVNQLRIVGALIQFRL